MLLEREKTGRNVFPYIVDIVENYTFSALFQVEAWALIRQNKLKHIVYSIVLNKLILCTYD